MACGVDFSDYCLKSVPTYYLRYFGCHYSILFLLALPYWTLTSNKAYMSAFMRMYIY